MRTHTSQLLLTPLMLGACGPIHEAPTSTQGRAPLIDAASSEAPSVTSKSELDIAPVAPAVPANGIDPLSLPDPAPGIDHAFRAERLLDAGDLPGALESLRRHLASNPETTALLLRIGRLFRSLGQPERARVALLRAEQREPDAVDVLLELGRLEMAVDDPKAAQVWGRRGVKLQPDDARLWNLLGRSAMARSAFQSAEFAYRRAVELAPTHGMYLNNLGLLYVLQRDGERAVSALEASLESFGSDAPRFVYNNLGLGRELQGDLQGAARAFREALLKDPGYVRAHVNLERIQSMRVAKVDALSETPNTP
ncbi:MAG: tetratricopeptide repeat protein [Myxococcota bacterium]